MTKSNLHRFAQVWKGLDPLDCQTSWGQSAFCGPCLSPELVVVRTGHLLAWCGNTQWHTCCDAGWSSHTLSGLSWCRMLTVGAWYQSVVLGPGAVLPLTRSLPDWLVSSVVTADSWQADSRAGTTHRSWHGGPGRRKLQPPGHHNIDATRTRSTWSHTRCSHCLVQYWFQVSDCEWVLAVVL